MNKGGVLSRPEAQEALKNYLFVELYTDTFPRNREIQDQRFGTVALPLYVILGPDGKERDRLAGQLDLQGFLDFLRKGLAPAPAGNGAPPK